MSLLQILKADFDRFLGLQKKQIADCPEHIWQKKSCGYYFWQQQLHSLYCIELFALPAGEAAPETPFPKGVIMLSEEPAGSMSKDEMLALADKMEAVAHRFINSLSDADLEKKQERMSKRLGRDMSNLNAIVALIRHCSYHLGCCDSVLREHGLPGVY